MGCEKRIFETGGQGGLPPWAASPSLGREGVTRAIPLMSLSEEFQQSVIINKNVLAPAHIRDVVWLGTFPYPDIFHAAIVNQRSWVFIQSKIFSKPDRGRAGRVH